ncbi:glycosyltransferase [Labrys wisconsinensis]|uniref:Hopene-associated glycosyltransferase HpnB n=1 Tax=Labrys wisconsinensis TaxID=425677 RepID=A0ABU0JAL2_9HYPH|nr:glycosyltransferase [Labrys wisconsinensis]MDQ0470581.1 hopene-associated glycosyltransferase HpnB [Labrys wisconsinensis]
MVLALLAAAVWIVLIAARGGFWRAAERDEPAAGAAPAAWPAVVAVVPARNEADVIARAVGSLLAQDYPGPFRVVLTDDNSEDGTAEQARAAAQALGAGERLTILSGAPLARGWTGKLWALSQGIAAAEANAPAYLWLSDADIVYTPDCLRTMVIRAEAGRLAAVSLMARLRCESLAERMLVPAFIFFFQMLYPFRWVNQAGARTAAAAGGCVLVRREALAGIGGIGAIRGALIDDCTLAAQLKRRGGRIWLGLTGRATSIRASERFEDIRRMVARSAYAQLRYSPLMLAGTILGMLLVYVAPPAIALFGPAPARYVALATWVAMALAFVPTLRFYDRSWLWGPLLPVIAVCYMGFTVDSALQHRAGRGGMWKGRAQAPRDA